MKLIKKVAQQNLRAFSTEIKTFNDVNKMANYVDDHKPTFSVVLLSSDWNPLLANKLRKSQKGS